MRVLVKYMVTIILCGWVALQIFPAQSLDLFEHEKEGHRSSLQRPLQIPIGFINHVPHHILLPEGTFFDEIPHIISQKRKESGLSPKIPQDEQEKLLQNTVWRQACITPILPPLAGCVVQVLVSKGQEVKQGDVLTVIECMKMEARTLAPVTGKATGVHISKGDIVGTNFVMIDVVPDAFVLEAIDAALLLENQHYFFGLFPWENEHTSVLSPPHFSFKRNAFVREIKIEEKRNSSFSPVTVETILKTILPLSSHFSMPQFFAATNSNSHTSKISVRKVKNFIKAHKKKSDMKTYSSKKSVLPEKHTSLFQERRAEKLSSPPSTFEGKNDLNWLRDNVKFYVFLGGLMVLGALGVLTSAFSRRRNKKLGWFISKDKYFYGTSLKKDKVPINRTAHNMNRHGLIKPRAA